MHVLAFSLIATFILTIIIVIIIGIITEYNGIGTVAATFVLVQTITFIFGLMVIMCCPTVPIADQVVVEKIEIASMGSTGYGEGHIGGILIMRGTIEGREYLTYYTPIGDNRYTFGKIPLDYSTIEIIDAPEDIGIYKCKTWVGIPCGSFNVSGLGSETSYVVKVLPGQFSNEIYIRP